MLDLKALYAAALIALALLGLLALQTVRLANAQRHHAKAVATLEKTVATAQASARATESAYRQLEQKNRDQLNRQRQAAQDQLAATTADARRAGAAGERLRSATARYAATHSAPAADRATAGHCAPDPAPIHLLAELQRRADERAGELAAIADTARARGSACEAEHDAARAMIAAAAGAADAYSTCSGSDCSSSDGGGGGGD